MQETKDIQVDKLIWNNQRPLQSFSDWYIGNIHFLELEPQYAVGELNHIIKDSKANYLLFWDQCMSPPDQELIISLCKQPVDIWHAGLKLGTNGLPHLIDYVSPTWMYNRDPDVDKVASSWRISLGACLVRAEVIKQLGFLNSHYKTIEAAALEWGYRCFMAGAIIRYAPSLLSKNGDQARKILLPPEDEMRFIHNSYGRLWSYWVLGRAILTRHVPISISGKLLRQILGNTNVINSKYFKHPEDYQPNMEKIKKLRVSVIIPTLDRYSFLEKVLRGLRNQTIDPFEIIAIDQTKESERQPDFYDQFTDLPLRVLFRDSPGQCSSRNAGILVAQGEYILLLDDDIEITPDFIKKHLLNLTKYSAGASCGITHNPGSIPSINPDDSIRVSSVFPAGNTLIRKNELARSGLFDLAYENGARADGDLGMRVNLNGTLMLLDPAINILHHRASSGGLRTHNARRITYDSSRQNLIQRHLPGATEIYLYKRYFSRQQVRERLWISLLGTFSINGSILKKILKVMISTVLLPHSLWVLYRHEKQAESMLKHYPQIPIFKT